MHIEINDEEVLLANSYYAWLGSILYYENNEGKFWIIQLFIVNYCMDLMYVTVNSWVNPIYVVTKE